MSMTADDIMGLDESGAREKIDFPPSPFATMTWKTETKGGKTLHLGRKLKGVLVKRVENIQKEKNNKGERVIAYQPETFRNGDPNPRHIDKKTGKPAPKTYDMIFVVAKEIDGVPLPDNCFRTTSGMIVYRDYLQGHKRWEFGQAKKEALGEKDQYKWPTGMGVSLEFADTEETAQGGIRWVWNIECTPVPAKGSKGYEAVASAVFEAYNAIKAYDEEIKALIAASGDGSGDLDDMVKDHHAGGDKAAWDEDEGDSSNPF